MTRNDLELDAFVRNSGYRMDTLQHLADDGPLTPTEIAAEADRHQSHVSRAIAELRERDLVELRVPENRTRGRLYALTDAGEAVWTRVAEDVGHVPWTVREPRNETEHDLLDLAEDAFGEHLRLVGVYDGTAFEVVHARTDVLDGYSEAEFDRAVRTLANDCAMADVELPKTTYRFELKMFARFSVLRVRTGPEEHVSLSVDAEEDVVAPAFAESIAETLDEEGATLNSPTETD